MTPRTLPLRSPKSSTLVLSGVTITTGSLCRIATARTRSEAAPSLRMTASCAFPSVSLSSASTGPDVGITDNRSGTLSVASARAPGCNQRRVVEAGGPNRQGQGRGFRKLAPNCDRKPAPEAETAYEEAPG